MLFLACWERTPCKTLTALVSLKSYVSGADQNQMGDMWSAADVLPPNALLDAWKLL